MEQLFELTRRLVDIESVTGNERACSEFVEDLLRRRGLQTKRQNVSPDRWNIFAWDGRPDVVLCTHLDTVPPFFPASEDEHAIYGRGSCDAKASVACQIFASDSLIQDGVHNLGLLFLVGEEILSDGANAANASPEGSRYLIMGEPTDNKLVVATKGVLHLQLRARGRLAHSAFPQLGESAIEKLLDALSDLRAMPLPADKELGPTTMNIGRISGGIAPNVVPDFAETELLYRIADGGEELRRRIEARLDGRCECKVLRHVPALRLERVEGFETEVVPYTTDATNLGRWGRPLLLGPGSVRVAHTDHESIRKEELVRGVDQYCRLVRHLAARAQEEQGSARV